jgi:hypothetical protein
MESENDGARSNNSFEISAHCGGRSRARTADLLLVKNGRALTRSISFRLSGRDIADAKNWEVWVCKYAEDK